MSVVPGVYKHYKGGLYLVVGQARHHETGEEIVVYHPLQPHTRGEPMRLNVRPLRGHEGDPDGFLDVVKVINPMGPGMIDGHRFTLMWELQPTLPEVTE